MRANTLVQFWSRVSKQGGDECWTWTGTVIEGYGQFKMGGSAHRAHRLSYELLRGAIPETLVIDHLCRNKVCVNPSHLEPVTIGTNALRGIGPTAVNSAKSACVWGHPFDEQNTYWIPDGTRKCRHCKNTRNMLYKRVGAEVRRDRRLRGLPVVDLGAYYATERLAS